MQADSIRVMLVDDHRSVLWGLEKLINGEWPRMSVVAQATNAAAAIEGAGACNPDVIVLDLDLGGEDGCDIIPPLLEGRDARVLVLTGIRDGQMREKSILRGACGVVHKQEPAETLLKAIEKVHQGELWLDRATTARVFVGLSRPKPAETLDERKLHSLTAREREIVEHLVADPGTDNRKLAQKLQMGEHTLRNHLSRIYDKLGVPNRLELYVYAQRHRLNGHRPS
jgi:two-component system, NarL family, nitrate/nitrite response regulator NarL